MVAVVQVDDVVDPLVHDEVAEGNDWVPELVGVFSVVPGLELGVVPGVEVGVVPGVEVGVVPGAELVV